MAQYATPRVVISRCIEFDHCRWNGLKIASDVARLLLPYVTFIPVCPEVEIGLGVPRDPVRLEQGEAAPRLVQPTTGRDLSEEMETFARSYLGALGRVDGFLLKSRSPSCGTRDARVYKTGGAGGPTERAAGAFGREVLERLPMVPVEDEGRLTNHLLRDHWLARVFTVASFRDTAAAGEAMGALVEWHGRAKMLLLAHHEPGMRDLGRIVANHDRLAPADVYARYETRLLEVLARPMRRPATINVLMHAMGHFSEQVSSSERAYLLDCLDAYRAGRLPLSVPVAVLRAWIARFGNAYLAEQLFFAPYPEELVQVTDSGKGRDL